MISNTCELCIPMPEDVYSIVTDASGLEIGGVLQVQREGRWEAAAFFSRQLRGAEQRYSATELEALAVVASVSHFAYYLYGHRFTVFTEAPRVQASRVDALDRISTRTRQRIRGCAVQGGEVQ